LFSLVWTNTYSQDSLYFFHAKSDVVIERNGKKEDFTAHILFNLRDTLWISFTGTFGIEGARMLMTTDSCFVINKLEGTAFAYSIYDDNNLIPYAFTIEDWKMLLLGHTKDTFQSTVEEENKIWKVGYDEHQTKKLLFDKKHLLQCKYIHTQTASKCDIKFSEFNIKKNEPTIAMTRSIRIDSHSEENVQISIKYVDYKFNQPQPFQFNFAKYKNAGN
jgi:hypothetical protein